MAFGPELRGIFHYLNIYAPIFQPNIVETRGADDYWQVETFILGSMENEERVITESFEVHAQEKEWCVRMAAHIALGRIVHMYAARLKGTVYAEMAKVLPSGNILPKRFRYVPGAIWPGTTSYIIQSLEKHIHCLEKNTQSDLYTITELQQRNTRLKRDNNKLKKERLEMQAEMTSLKEKMKANGIEEPEEEPEVETSAEEREPSPKRRNRISGREYRMLFSKDSIKNYFVEY